MKELRTLPVGSQSPLCFSPPLQVFTIKIPVSLKKEFKTITRLDNS